MNTNYPPRLGLSEFKVQAENGLLSGFVAFYQASSLAVIPTPIPGSNGCLILLDLVSAQDFINLGYSPIGPITSPTGRAEFRVPIPLDPTLAGLTVCVQATSFDGISFLTSNAMNLTFMY
jgi:hypothetical protein